MTTWLLYLTPVVLLVSVTLHWWFRFRAWFLETDAWASYKQVIHEQDTPQS